MGCEADRGQENGGGQGVGREADRGLLRVRRNIINIKARLSDGLFFWSGLTFVAGIDHQEKCPLKGLTAGR